jgi:hypothetical protein
LRRVGGRWASVFLPPPELEYGRAFAATIPPPPSIYSSPILPSHHSPILRTAHPPSPAHTHTQDPPIFSTLTGIQLDSECCAHAHMYPHLIHLIHLIGYFTRSHILTSIYSYSRLIFVYHRDLPLFLLLPSSVAFPPPRPTSYAPPPSLRLRPRSVYLHASHTSMRAAPHARSLARATNTSPPYILYSTPLVVFATYLDRRGSDRTAHRRSIAACMPLYRRMEWNGITSALLCSRERFQGWKDGRIRGKD